MGGKRRTSDHFSKRARREKYPARSIYKLAEIDKKVQLFKTGSFVLDLGAAPGSWTMFAAKQVGPSGKVIAVDRAPLTIGLPANAVTIEGDALAILPEDLLALIPRDGFDAVISDMAPRTSGHRFTDQSRSFNLFCRALELATLLCKPGGHFVGKIFQGEDFDAARQKVSDSFLKTKIIRPTSVRSESYEVYLVGLSRRRISSHSTKG